MGVNERTRQGTLPGGEDNRSISMFPGQTPASDWLNMNTSDWLTQVENGTQLYAM